MKLQLNRSGILFFVGSSCMISACSSSGIEPNWNELASSEGRPRWSIRQIADARNFRVEVRDLSNQDAAHNNVSFSIGRRNRFGTAGASSKSIQQNRSFTIVQPGRRSQLIFQGRTYLLEIGRPQGRQIEIGIQAISTQNYATRSGRTRIRTPIGQWFTVWGIAGGDTTARQNSSLNSSWSKTRSWESVGADSKLEMRITPAAF